jgi:hypothetical protein
MAGNPDRDRHGPSPDGDWPAWLDDDDFDGMGEEAWRAAMESLAEEGPLPDEELFAPPDDDAPAATPALVPALGFGSGEAGESLPPGVSLAMLTERVVGDGSLRAMSDYEVVRLVAAARRQQNRAQWLELQAIGEFSRRRWESDQAPARDEDGRWQFKNSAAEQAADELAFELADGRVQAEDRMDLSLALRDRLPRLDAVLAEGRIDDRRSVSDILCAGFFAARFRMVIRFLFFALSDVLVPGFPGGLAEPDLPCSTRADAACPGFPRVPCLAGRRLAWPSRASAAFPVRDFKVSHRNGGAA